MKGVEIVSPHGEAQVGSLREVGEQRTANCRGGKRRPPPDPDSMNAALCPHLFHLCPRVPKKSKEEEDGQRIGLGKGG